MASLSFSLRIGFNVWKPAASRCPFAASQFTKCQYCGAGTTLLEHILVTHVAPKRYQCGVCSGLCSTWPQLKRHLDQMNHRMAPESGRIYAPLLNPDAGKDGTKVSIRFPHPAPNLSSVVTIIYTSQGGGDTIVYQQEVAVVYSIETTVLVTIPGFYSGRSSMVFDLKIKDIQHLPLSFHWHPTNEYDAAEVISGLRLPRHIRRKTSIFFQSSVGFLSLLKLSFLCPPPQCVAQEFLSIPSGNQTARGVPRMNRKAWFAAVEMEL